MTRTRCFALTEPAARSARKRVACATVGLIVVLGVVPATAGAARTGNLFAWGYNANGQLGDATAANKYEPIRTHLLTDLNVVAVSGSYGVHTVAVTEGGGVLAWGTGTHGVLGDGSGETALSPIAADLSALDPDEFVTAADAGYVHSIALTTKRRVFTWGNDDAGELGNGALGNSVLPQLVKLPPKTTIKAIAAGGRHNLALTDKGEVLAWGRGHAGAMGIGDATWANQQEPVKVKLPPDTTATAIAAGEYYSMALTTEGKVLTWGANEYLQLGVTGKAASVYSDVPVYASIPEGTTITAIAAGWHSSLAVTSTGEGLAWGADDQGEIGDGATTRVSRDTPTKINLPDDDVKLAAVTSGLAHSAALTTDGRVLVWGYGGSGEHGVDKKTESSSTPAFAKLPPKVYAGSIDAGEYTMHAVSGPQPITARRSKDPVVEAHERLAEQQPPASVLACVKSAAAILDVYRDGDQVRVVGVAGPGFTGKLVDIRFLGGKKEIVGQARVAADSRFTAVFDGPDEDELGKDTTRYTAELAGTVSPDVRLERRLNIDSVKRDGDTITIRGRVDAPLARVNGEVPKVRLIQSTKCRDRPQVAADAPDSDGNVTFRVPAPDGPSAVFYRLDSLVGGKDGNVETTSLFYGIEL
jgi:alpha-tubulin suppressor-like RCC1 family protein